MCFLSGPGEAARSVHHPCASEHVRLPTVFQMVFIYGYAKKKEKKKVEGKKMNRRL